MDELADPFEFFDNPPDRLIQPAQTDALSVDFIDDPHRRDWRIWDGYLQASSLLLSEMLRRRRSCRSLIFPAMFNLRHGLEVALKWHIDYAGGAVPARAGHDLGVLIEAFRATAAGLDADTTYISEYHFGLIAELAAVDPRSIAFRYATGRDGSSIALSDTPWDVRTLSFAVEHLFLWFDHLAGWIDMANEA